MRCEVVAIGTELLLGIIHDTNSSWIGEQLALSGIDSYYQVKVGDNFERIETTLRSALERSDAVICCGGLGPTQDDITRDVIAHIMDSGMQRDEAIAAEIQRRFERRGRTMSANNLRQADVPVGASPIAQMPGTAPGLVCPVGDKVIYAVPGVPREMREMMEGTILPDLRARAGVSGIIRHRVLRCWGVSESGLAEMLNERIVELDRSGTATIAFQASGIEGIKIRIVTKRDNEADAIAALDAEEAIIRPIVGDAIFGVDDEDHGKVGHRTTTPSIIEPCSNRDIDRRHSIVTIDGRRCGDGGFSRWYRYATGLHSAWRRHCILRIDRGCFCATGV